MAKGMIKQRGKNGIYWIVYDAGHKWSEEREAMVRNRVWERVPEPNNKRHAQQILNRRLTEVDSGEFIQPSTETFRAFKEYWWETYAEGEVSPITLDLYESLLKLYILPVLGDLIISKIGVEHIQKLKSVMAQRLGPQRIKHGLRLVRQMLNHAVDWNRIRKNPAVKVKYPVVPNPQPKFYTPKEWARFLRTLNEKFETPELEKWTALLMLGVSGGLRIGEILAARWKHLDPEKGQYYVCEKLIRARKGRPSTTGPPKRDSAGWVDLSPRCLEALEKHRELQAEEKDETGEKYQDQGLIFATKKGGYMNDSNVLQRMMYPVQTKANLEKMGTHFMRHMCAVLLIENEESPKYIQQQMRHKSIEMTFDVYGALFEDREKRSSDRGRNAAARLDKMLFSEAG